MVITESLAKGLKNRFFLEITDEINRKLSKASDIGSPGKKSPAAWQRYQDKFKNIFGRCALVFYSGGSKNKPYFALLGLSVNEDREFNQWHEKCLTGHMVVINSEPRIADDMYALFNIGEHAISRIYERGSIAINKEMQVDIFSILPEFHLIPIWSSFWGSIFTLFKQYYSNLDEELNLVYPVIPAKSGLFFGQISYEKLSLLEIRTFVDDKNLSFQQETAKQAMLRMTSGYEISPFCFYPVVGSLGLDNDVYQSQILCFELLKEYDLISSVIFHRVNDDKLRYLLKEKFKKCLLEHSSTMTQDIIDISREIGIKNFQLELKKALLRASMSSQN